MQIQQNNFIQKLLSLDRAYRRLPDVSGKANRYLSKQTDARLVKYIRRGNSRAFNVLIKRHERNLKKCLHGCLFDKSFIDDAAQDVWNSLFRN